MKKGSDKFFRTGTWNGCVFSGVPELRATPVYDFSFVSNKDEAYFMFHMIKTSLVPRAVMNQTQYEHYIWVDGKWKQYLYLPRDNCDAYNLCGAYGNCIIGESPACQCVQGFKPKSPDTWNPDEWSKGCIRSTQLSSQDKDKSVVFWVQIAKYHIFLGEPTYES
nr:g-type lectin s-receptor-like serine/threonine-protein kinase [Quercus suber]POF24218.1 g-type lectin s-receptor-like serine/threonine-protein kinase [Quercus suber]